MIRKSHPFFVLSKSIRPLHCKENSGQVDNKEVRELTSFFSIFTFLDSLCSFSLFGLNNRVMPGIHYIQVSGREILVVNYSGCKSDQMIEIFNLAKREILAKGERCRVLTDLSHTYITPNFMRHAEREMLEVKHLIIKNAFIGMTQPKRIILRGFSLLMGKRDFVAFDTEEEALEYLTQDDVQ